jgi:D-3-phosphoglycerate dehydrogenase
MKRVVFIDTVHSILEERLAKNGFHCIDATNFSLTACIKELSTAYGMVIRSRFPVNETLLKNAKSLKFIARSGAGMENIDLEYCGINNITLFNAPEGNRNAVAEQALGMILALFNQLKRGDSEVRKGIWDREGNRGIELDGKTVGIIGFGNNGSAFAKKLSGFDVHILAYDKYLSNYGNSHVKEASLEEIAEQADVLSFHIPQNEETLFMGNNHFFNQFKKPFYLINLSRGKIVKTSHLLEALEQKKILGACLDVLEYEKASFENLDNTTIPKELQQLFQSEKVLFSPHVGGWTHESYFKLSNVLADKILDWEKQQ